MILAEIRTYLQKRADLLAQLALTPNFKVTFLAQGEYNQNYLVTDGDKQYVFRLNYGSQLGLNHQIEYEYHALSWLQRSGCTPEVYYVDDSRQAFEQGLLIMQYLKGRPLDYHQDLPVAASIFGRIHQLPVDDLAEQQFVLEKDNILTARIEECRTLLAPVFHSAYLDIKVKRQLEQALNTCENHVSQQRFFQDLKLWRVNNTEVNAHNFIIGDQGWLIDWEKPVISHPVQDISQFLASTTTLWRSDVRLSQAAKEAFLKAYLSLTGFEQAPFREALYIYHPYLMLRALSWSAMAYDRYCSDTKALKNQEIFDKVTQYMKPDFLQAALKEQVFDS